MRTGPSLKRKGTWKSIATPPSTEPQTFAFVKIDLGSCNLLVLASCLLHSLYIQAAGYKNCDISSANAETLAVRGPAKGTPRRAGFVVLSLSLRSRGSRARTQRRGANGQPCRTERSTADTLERLPFTCTTAWGLWYIMLIHLRNSGLNPAVSKTVAKNRWSTLSKALDRSKLISAATVPSFIPSRTSRIKCRLSWIDLPFTAKVCPEPIRSLMTSCKRFAKTRAKIFNSVLSRVMGL